LVDGLMATTQRITVPRRPDCPGHGAAHPPVPALETSLAPQKPSQ
jgi:hypothetical protein